MTKNIYMVYFYTGIAPKHIDRVHPLVYFTEVEAENNANIEIADEKRRYKNSTLKYKILKLELYESNSINFIKSEL